MSQIKTNRQYEFHDLKKHILDALNPSHPSNTQLIELKGRYINLATDDIIGLVKHSTEFGYLYCNTITPNITTFTFHKGPHFIYFIDHPEIELDLIRNYKPKYLGL